MASGWRASAIRWFPRASACSATCREVRSFAPTTAIFMALFASYRDAVGGRGGCAGAGDLAVEPDMYGALRQMVHKIETAAGFTIVDRSASPLTSTEWGRDFLHEAIQILQTARETPGREHRITRVTAGKPAAT